MKQKILLIFIAALLPITFIYPQDVIENYKSPCYYEKNVRQRLKTYLPKAYKKAVDAILNGREGRRLPQCKINEINQSLANIKNIEYGCAGYYCSWATKGKGNTEHPEILGTGFLIICDPWATLTSDINTGFERLEGLMVHEIIHATTGGDEYEAVDCSRIPYPNAGDPWHIGTPDHRYCCCNNK